MKIKTLKQREKDHLLTVLNKTFWDIGKSAHLLKIPKEDVLNKIKEYGLVENNSSKANDRYD